MCVSQCIIFAAFCSKLVLVVYLFVWRLAGLCLNLIKTLCYVMLCYLSDRAISVTDKKEDYIREKFCPVGARLL